MKKQIKFSFAIITLYTVCIFSSTVHATTGGGQTVEILGYEVKEQKVYLLRDFEDSRGRVPQLYYYDLKTTTPTKLIEVKSIYLDPQLAKVDYDNRWDEVMHEIDKIKRRLVPLSTLKTANFNLNIQQKINSVPAWHDPQEKMRQYSYTYTVAESDLKSITHKAISYKPGLSIQQALKIPHHDKVIVTIKYLAFPEETGYTTEDPVMLIPHQ